MATFPLVRVHHPRPHDIVDNPVAVSGIGAAFEGVIGQAVLRDHNGNPVGSKSVSGHIGMGFSNFEFTIALSAAPQGGPRGTLEIAPDDPSGNGVASVVVPIVFGNTLIAGYHGFFAHKVVAGNTLGNIASLYYGANNATNRNRIFDANRDVLNNPNVIVVGMNLRIPSTG
jgi:Immunoglobulin-like domain of bacterial spore germination/LysM domain